MAPVRWAPAREFRPMQSEINRLFNSFFDTATPVATPATASRRFLPPMDVVETEQEYVLRADLPGIPESDVKIEILDGVLTVSGERKREDQEQRDGYRRIERVAGSFSRSLKLPKGVDAAAVSAQFEHGVLEIHVPKPEESKPQAVQIAVNGAEQTTIEA